MWKNVALDAAAVALFALLARIAHNTPEMPLSVGGWFGTMLPFLAGTLAIYLLLPQVRRAPARLGSGVAVWLGTAVAGLSIWGVRHGHVPHISFIIVATVTSGLLLLGWRGVAAVRRR
ncbi:DUF3054 domain-containing protein [Corynebacterium sp. 13CS0277]|uniref:DUF3054 domain-containing protein n=1 Tax=Corynebacterium sp. 13CS0277 TaxID=2071994 RepID=UPI000D026804|nr:DUF3054 domain-containing protein [Corynebacterium sp. 13CS0277]PRQ11852.1 DUF3054 domain-containing protein [Corynebacterium sp. 13CS0277]